MPPSVPFRKRRGSCASALSSGQWREKRSKIVRAETELFFLRFFQHAGGEEGLFLLQRQDFFLNTPGNNQFVNKNLTFLADAVGTIGGLIFGGGIPPWIIVDYGVCCL
jgi:hypothetical protein